MYRERGMRLGEVRNFGQCLCDKFRLIESFPHDFSLMMAK